MALATVLLLVALAILHFVRTGSRTAVQVPTPANPGSLGPQLRAYVDEKVTWAREAPRDPQRLATLGLVYAANLLWSEARAAFSNAARLNPNEPLAQLYVAVAAQESGESTEALQLFRRLTVRFPSFPQGFYRLGEAALRAGSVEEAATAFQRLTELAPQEWRGYAGLGEVCLRRGQFAAAAAQLERAIQLDPDAGNAHHLLGSAYRSLGRTEDAQLHLSRGLNQLNYPMPDPWGESAPRHMKLIQDQLDQAGNYCRAGRADQAVALLREALRYEPTNLSLLNNLAMAFNQGGHPDDARPVLQKILELDARNLPAHITLSLNCHELGQADEALAWADKAVALATNVAQPHLVRANALLALERDQDALAALESAARCDSQNAEIQVEIGDVLLQNLSQPGAALDRYLKAAELNPSLDSAQVRLAQLYLDQGQWNTVRAALARLKLIQPRHPAIPPLERELAQRQAQAGRN